MARKSMYVSQQCSYESTGWLGKCPNCNSWGSLVESVSDFTTSKKGRRQRKASVAAVNLASIKQKDTARIDTKIEELNTSLGGGLVKGQVVLLAGEPGVGKSTILIQMADKLGKVLYASGEESAYQLKIRADRLKLKSKKIEILETSDIDEVVQKASEENYKAIIVDSIQTFQTTDLSGMAGSVGQVRECSYRLVRLAKKTNTPVFIVGHVTKQGSVAGPAVLAHIVDTVLWFEGDKNLTIRILRAVKNRFGPTDEVGIFTMEEKGLVSATDPEKLFITQTRGAQVGSVVTSVMQGTRPILVEIQGLVVPTKTSFPKRIAQGVDAKRFELLLAVLTRRAGLPMYDNDCYLNVSGGIAIKEPAADLAICLVIASSFFDKPLPKGSVAIGEVGLLGDIRGVTQQQKRVKNAKKMGYKNVISSEDRNVSGAIKKLLK